MKAFRDAKIKGLRAHQWEHGQYGPLQNKLHIPRIYCPVEKYFDQVERFPAAVYKVRCCPLFDYYLLLCRDTPGYVANIRPPMGQVHGAKVERPSRKAVIIHGVLNQKR
jgi:hypothetical protein